MCYGYLDKMAVRFAAVALTTRAARVVQISPKKGPMLRYPPGRPNGGF